MRASPLKSIAAIDAQWVARRGKSATAICLRINVHTPASSKRMRMAANQGGAATAPLASLTPWGIDVQMHQLFQASQKGLDQVRLGLGNLQPIEESIFQPGHDWPGIVARREKARSRCPISISRASSIWDVRVGVEGSEPRPSRG